MWAIWVKYLYPPALNGCPKCKKSPNLVTLVLWVLQLTFFRCVIQYQKRILFRIVFISTLKRCRKKIPHDDDATLTSSETIWQRHRSRSFEGVEMFTLAFLTWRKVRFPGDRMSRTQVRTSPHLQTTPSAHTNCQPYIGRSDS